MASSRWQFAAFVDDQKSAPTIALIAEALTLADEVPAKVLVDRLGCLSGWLAPVPIVTPPSACPADETFGIEDQDTFTIDTQPPAVCEVGERSVDGFARSTDELGELFLSQIVRDA